MLSATFVRNANRPGRYGDGRGGLGLGLLVRPALRGGVNKSWTQSVRIDGRPTSLGLGRYPVVTLAMARERALENARAIAQGRDPRRSARVVPTLADALETVIGIHAPHWKDRAGSERQWRASLAAYALPRIGDKTVDAVTSADVMAVLLPIWSTKRAAALGRGRLHQEAVAPVRVRRRQLDRLLPPQAERRLQPQRHPHVGVPHAREPRPVEVAPPRAVGDVRPPLDAVVRVVPDHPGLADPPGPPAHVRHAVHHGGVGKAAFLPVAHQGLDVPRLQPLGAQAAEAEFVQRLRHLRKRVGAVAARGVGADVALPPLKPEQVPVQVPHGHPIR